MDRQDYFDVALAAIFDFDKGFFEECFPGLIFTVFQSFFHNSATGQKSGIITGWCWKFATAMFHPTQSTLVGTLFKRQVYLILGLKPPARSTLPTHQLPSAYCLQAVIANPVEHFRFAGRAYDLARHTWRWKPAKAETRASSVWSRVSASVSEGSWCFHRLFPWFFLKMRIG